MLKITLLACLSLTLLTLAACQSSPTTAADGSKLSSDPGIKVSGYVEAGGSSTLR